MEMEERWDSNQENKRSWASHKETSCWARYDAETSGHSLGLFAHTRDNPRLTYADANEPKSGHADYPTWTQVRHYGNLRVGTGCERNVVTGLGVIAWNLGKGGRARGSFELGGSVSKEQGARGDV